MLFRRSYLSDGFPQGFIEFVKDLFFATTYPGSWFLSALFMSVLVVYFGIKVVGKSIMLCVALLVSVYVYYIDSLPEPLHVFYDWYALNVREDVALSFPSQVIWVAMGMIIGTHLNMIISHKKRLLPVAVVLCVMCYGITIFWHTLFVKYIWVISICLIGFLVDLSDKPIYGRIRIYSILIFLFHFSIAGKMSVFCSVVGDSLVTNWIYYALVVVVSIVFAESVLRLEKIRFFVFLRYLH